MESYRKRADRLASLLLAGRVVRRLASPTSDCFTLLEAIAPEHMVNRTARSMNDLVEFPSAVLPRWFSKVLDGAFGPDHRGCAEVSWKPLASRLVSLLERFVCLDQDDWSRLDWAARAVMLRRISEGNVDFDATIALCERAAKGGASPSQEERDEAGRALYCYGLRVAFAPPGGEHFGVVYLLEKAQEAARRRFEAADPDNPRRWSEIEEVKRKASSDVIFDILNEIEEVVKRKEMSHDGT